MARTVSFILFCLCVLVWLLSFVPAVPLSPHWAIPLALMMFPLFFATILSVNQLHRSAAAPPVVGSGVLARWRQSNRSTRDFHKRLFALLPPWLRLTCVLVFTVGLLNFFACLGLMQGASPTHENGLYYLKGHGRVVREVTWQEYRRLRAVQARLISGHVMMFALVPAVFFGWIHPAAKRDASSGGSEGASVGRGAGGGST